MKIFKQHIKKRILITKQSDIRDDIGQINEFNSD